MSSKPLDPAIQAALPPGSQIVSVAKHGDTRWSTGFKVCVEVDGKEESYFLKIIEDNELLGMAEAEYEGQKAMSAIIPENAAKPIAWGYHEIGETKSWFLTRFRNLRATTSGTSGSPENINEMHHDLLNIVTKMHQQSQSPTGKFGFHVTPHYGPPPMIVDWTDNWEEFWTREFRSGLKYVQRMRGEDLELLKVAEEFIDKVVPRLLRPLQTGGRNIKPSLCHGDLWDGNIQTDCDTGEQVLFDPCPFYGHSEMDLQCMRTSQYSIGLQFVERYRKFGASKPVDDFDDRNALYALRNNIMAAGMFPQYISLLGQVKNDMRRLISKHPDGLAGFKGDLTPTKSLPN